MEPNPSKLNQMLLAKLRLQRYVFAAFALVLFLIGSVGLSAWKAMSKDRDRAQILAFDNKSKADSEATTARRIKSALVKSQSESSELKHKYAEALLLLATTDLDEGRIASAREKYQQAMASSPPLWAPIIAARIPKKTLAFDSGQTIAAALDYRSKFLLAACNVKGNLLLRLFDANSGKLMDEHMLPGESIDCEVFWWRGSDEGLLRVGDQARAFSIHKSKLILLDQQIVWPKGKGVSLGGKAIAVHDLDQLTVLRRGSNNIQTVVHELRGANGLIIAATELADGSVVYLDQTGVKRLNGDRVDRLYTPQIQALEGRLHQSGNVLYLGLRNNEVLNHVTLALDVSMPVEVVSRKLSSGADSLLRFMRDGTLLLAARGGMALLADPEGIDSLTLGEKQVEIAIKHPHGIIFGAAQTGLSLRPQSNSNLGSQLAALPNNVHILASPYGFLCTSKSGNRFVFRGRSGFESAGSASLVILTSRAIVSAEGSKITLPGGILVRNAGQLLGVYRTGELLLWNEGLKMRLSDGSQVNVETNLTHAPTMFAGSENIVAMHLKGRMVISRFNKSTESIDLPDGFEPSLLAVSEDGFVAHSGRTALVWSGGNLTSVPTEFVPKQSALLFSNQVLAISDGQKLVLVQVSSGRKLWSIKGKLDSLAATSRNSLLIASDGQLREFSFGG
ncbi:MAG: hypothetical protein L3J82_07515 [Planctomycetes bacterium]|nr:hypothetical protein [Planctomycetota bacterium]